jgi:hypothetical protein
MAENRLVAWRWTRLSSRVDSTRVRTWQGARAAAAYIIELDPLVWQRVDRIDEHRSVT